MSRDECELIIGRLFYNGLLSLEMGYTAYATNTYLKLNPQGSRLLQGLLLPLDLRRTCSVLQNAKCDCHLVALATSGSIAPFDTGWTGRWLVVPYGAMHCYS